MNHGTSHLIWMAVVFIGLLIIGKVVGVGLLVLFPVFCFFMMAIMMLGMGHNSNDKHKH